MVNKITPHPFCYSAERKLLEKLKRAPPFGSRFSPQGRRTIEESFYKKDRRIEESKMKVNFSFPFLSWSGSRDKTTYAAWHDKAVCIAKEYAVPPYSTQNSTIGAIATNLGVVYDSFDSGWVDDLKTYCARYKTDVVGQYDIPPTFYALYSKMWWAVNKDDPTIDLKTVTFADISLIGISIQTVKEAIDYGYLPKVNKFDDLTHTYNGA
jgi:hypothetical protein